MVSSTFFQFPKLDSKYRPVLPALLLAMLFGLVVMPAHAASQPTLMAGELSAPDWSFKHDSPLEIRGEWEVIWGKLVAPEDFTQNYSGDYFILPGRWNDVASPLMDGSKGVATFRARLRLPNYERGVAYHMIAAHSAYRLYLDGDLLVTNGTVSEDPSKVLSNHVSRRFDGDSGDSELVMQVANFTHAYGGPGHGLMLWDVMELNRFLDTISIIYGLVAGIIFTIGLFHLILYLADRRDQNSAIHFWFSILCFIIVYRVQGVVPLLHQYFSDTQYWADLRFTYVSLYAAPAVYLLFFRAVFRDQFPKLLTNSVVALALLGVVFTLFVSEYSYTATRNFAIWLNVFAIAYSLFFTIVAVRANQPGAWVILVSNFVFLVTAIYDAIIYTDQTTGFDSTPFGILVLGIGYSYALFLRLQSTFQEARNTSRALAALNLDLENQVTERTREMRSATAKAEDSARDKARFIAAASHDLRQPLHALALFNNALKRKLKSSESVSLLERQESAISSLGTLLQDTLDTAQLEIRDKPLKLAPINTEDIRKKIIDDFAEKAMSRDITLSVEIESGEIVTDLVMLQRILGNLLDNALKAAKRSIKVAIEKIDAHWCFVIEDDGVGIPQQDIERIFESYVSLQEESDELKRIGDQSGGYGLGLYIVKEFSLALGGEIEVESEPNRGAKFTLCLPIQQNLSQSEDSRPKTNLHFAFPKDLKVLAIDDEAIILDAMEAVLVSWNCEVALAKDAATALALVDDFKPDIVLLDYHLQGITGPELKLQLDTKIGEAIATVVITGATEPVILEQLQSQGLSVLSKPVDPNKLAIAMLSEMERTKPSQL